MGRIFKSILRVLAIVVAVIAVCLLCVAAIQYCLPSDGSFQLLGKTGLLADMPLVGDFLGSLTPASALGIGLVGLVLAFFIDADAAQSVVSRVGDAAAGIVTGVTGAVLSMADGVTSSLFSSPIGIALLCVGGFMLYRYLTKGNNDKHDDGDITNANYPNQTHLKQSNLEYS